MNKIVLITFFLVHKASVEACGVGFNNLLADIHSLNTVGPAMRGDISESCSEEDFKKISLQASLLNTLFAQRLNFFKKYPHSQNRTLLEKINYEDVMGVTSMMSQDAKESSCKNIHFIRIWNFKKREYIEALDISEKSFTQLEVNLLEKLSFHQQAMLKKEKKGND